RQHRGEVLLVGLQGGKHGLAELVPYRRILRKLQVALDLRPLRADGLATVGPRRGAEALAEVAQLRLVQDSRDVQQHGRLRLARGQNVKLAVSIAVRGAPGV